MTVEVTSSYGIYKTMCHDDIFIYCCLEKDNDGALKFHMIFLPSKQVPTSLSTVF